MNRRWLASATSKEETEELKIVVLSSKRALGLLESILLEKIEGSHKELLEKANYDKPAWSENVADLLGYQRALNEVKQLLEV